MDTQGSSEHATTDRISERAHETVDQAARGAGKAEERIRREAERAEDSAKEAGAKIKEQSEESLQSITSFVGEHPFLSLGLAFAAGTLVSTLRRR
ncbi:hypothetical protein [Thioalkalivibrio sp. ALR17-21]|uniref:hypothetical protein n=1 Tax=Thioalkalivibrio sp. ALR17-21 TaxID=1269813 RepID=UPI000415C406|nr:hypothetical protein [Thioalkalivibrio sp. ALR17-21]